MNTVIKILILNLIILLLACKKEKEYYNIPEIIRKATLYYTTYNIGDTTIKYLYNNSDTIILKVYIKENGYESRLVHEKYKRYEYFDLIASSSNFLTIRSLTRFRYENSSDYYFQSSFDISKDNRSVGFLISEGNIKYFSSKVINNNLYLNVYLLNKDGDSIYTSPDKGIIKAWNDSVTFSIIE